MRCSYREHRQPVSIRMIVCTFALLLAAAAPAFAQFDRGTISGTIKDQQGGVVPGVTVTVTNQATQQSRSAVTDGSGYFTLPLLEPSRYDIAAELDGFKKITRQNVQLDAGASIAPRLRARNRRDDRGRERDGRGAAAADRRHDPQDGRGEGHRAALVLGPQPDRRRRPQGRRQSAATSTTAASATWATAASTSTAAAIRREQHHGRRRHRHPHARRRATSSASRTSMRSRKCRCSPPTTCPSTGVPAAGRSASSPRAAATATAAAPRSSCATNRCRPTPGRATAAPTRSRTAGPAPFDYKQYGYCVRRPDAGRDVQGQAVLLRRAGVGGLLPGRRPTPTTVPTEAMRRGDFSELLNPNNGFYTGARTIMDPTTGQPFPGNIIPTNRLSANGVAFLNRIRCRRPASGRARRT